MKAISYFENCLASINMAKTELFLVGDLNVDFQNKSSANVKKITFFITSNGLTKLVNTTTRNTNKTKTLLDVVLSNSKCVSCSGTLDHHISDHQPIYAVHKKERDKRDKVQFRGRSYRNFNSEVFREKLRNARWEEFYDLGDPEEAWNFMLGRITLILDEMCPIQTFQIRNYRPDWMTDELIEQIKDRDYFYRKAKASGNEDDWNIARHLRNVTNLNIRQSKKDFILEQLKENEDNSRKFWKVIRKVVPSKQSSCQEILLKDKGQKLDENQVVDYINDFFINVGKVDRPLGTGEDPTLNLNALDGDSTYIQASPYLNDDIPSKCFDRLTESEVYRVVREVNISKSSGIENVSSFVLKEAFSALAAEVTHMFNLSLQNASFPSQWKKALVVPIPKSGNLNNVQNYRPISLLPLPGKILEKSIHKQVSTFLDENSLLLDKQHGFRKSHSTLHSAAQLVNYVNTNLDCRRPTLAAYIDFRKAFDCVQHDLLIDKLRRMYLHPTVIDWIGSYLQGREQKVYANGVFSASKVVTQGVPQGSVLGPLFYIVYANDLSSLFNNCEFAMYADDTTRIII